MRIFVQKKILNEYCELKEEKDLIELLEDIKFDSVDIPKDGLKKIVKKGRTAIEGFIEDKFNYKGVYIAVVKYNDGKKEIIKIGSAGGIRKRNGSWEKTNQTIGERITNTNGLFLGGRGKIRKEIKAMSKNKNIERLIIYAIKIEEEDIEKGCQLTPRALEAILIALYIKITGILPLLHKQDG